MSGDRQDLLDQLADYTRSSGQTKRSSHTRPPQPSWLSSSATSAVVVPSKHPGRYARVSFAMRSGKQLADDKQVTIELREHMWGNDYRVFIEGMVESLRVCKLTSATEPDRRRHVQEYAQGLAESESEVNEGPAIKKTMTVDEAIKVFEDTQAKLDFQEL